MMTDVNWGTLLLSPDSNKALTRTVTAGAVLLLHLGLLMSLMRTTNDQRPLPQLVERVIWLHLTRPAQQEVRPRTAQRSREAGASPATRLPSAPALGIPSLPDQKRLSGLHVELFGCAPENLANLDPETQSQCRGAGALNGYDPTSVDFADRSADVHGAQIWAAELARKMAPVRVPCTFMFSDGTGNGPIPMVDPVCALREAINGLKKEDFGGYAITTQDYGH